MVFFSWKMFITILCGFLFCSVFFFLLLSLLPHTPAFSAKVFGRCRWGQWKQLSSNSSGFVIKKQILLWFGQTRYFLCSLIHPVSIIVFGTVSNAPVIMGTLCIRFSRLYFPGNYNLNSLKSRVNRPHPHNFHLSTFILHTSLH